MDAVDWPGYQIRFEPQVSHCPQCGADVYGCFPVECADCLRLRPIKQLLHCVRDLLEEIARK